VSSKKNSDAPLVARLRDTLVTLLGNAPDVVLCVAYSGGIDSSVLLQLLVELRAERPFDLQAIHVNHGIHADADEWEKLCLRNCKQLGVPLVIERVSVQNRGEGIEAAARAARYQALEKHITSASYVLLTAHHQEDQAETLLLHLVRGSGVSGLAAMPATRAFGKGRLVRPLLQFSRAELVDYAKYQGLKWVEDGSNADPEIRRSFLRQEIFPKLIQHWPGTIKALNRTARHMAEADTLLQELGEADRLACLHEDGSSLSLAKLAVLSVERQQNLLRQWCRVNGFAMPSTSRVDELCRLVRNPPATASAEVFLGDTWACLYRDRLSLEQLEPAGLPEDLDWDLSSSASARFGPFRLTVSESVGAGLARSRIGNRVLVTRRQGGERCRLPGYTHHTTLKNLFQQHGIAPRERDRLPLLYVGDELAAIGDRWVCEPYAARKDEPSWELKLSIISRK